MEITWVSETLVSLWTNQPQSCHPSRHIKWDNKVLNCSNHDKLGFLFFTTKCLPTDLAGIWLYALPRRAKKSASHSHCPLLSDSVGFLGHSCLTPLFWFIVNPFPLLLLMVPLISAPACYSEFPLNYHPTNPQPSHLVAQLSILMVASRRRSWKPWVLMMLCNGWQMFLGFP